MLASFGQVNRGNSFNGVQTLLPGILSNAQTAFGLNPAGGLFAPAVPNLLGQLTGYPLGAGQGLVGIPNGTAIAPTGLNPFGSNAQGLGSVNPFAGFNAQGLNNLGINTVGGLNPLSINNQGLNSLGGLNPQALLTPQATLVPQSPLLQGQNLLQAPQSSVDTEEQASEEDSSEVVAEAEAQIEEASEEVNS